MRIAIDRLIDAHITEVKQKQRPRRYRRIYLTMIGSTLLVSTHVPVLQHLDAATGGWLVPSVIALAAVFWSMRELTPA